MATRKTFTDLDVVNQALTAMGEGRLSDLSTDQSTAAIVMREHYDRVKESCLSSGSNWRFATVKKALSKLSAEPVNRWAAAWQLPVDHVKTISVWPPARYEINGQRLFINAESGVELDYVRIVPEAEWPPWFTRLVVAELVLATCKGITGDNPSRAMEREQERALTAAQFQDAQQQPNQEEAIPAPFVDCRY